ncbi:MAG TPA: YihY/virulence factor BrkB family protein [Micromonosporaceae bacterium]
MNPIDRVVSGFNGTVAAARNRSGAFDHFWRARERYGEVLGGRLAAAIAYYGFFAIFALGLVLASVLGFLLEHNIDLQGTVNTFLRQHLNVVSPASIDEAQRQFQSRRGAFAVVGLIGLTLTGIGWIEAIRSSQRLIWGIEQQPGNLIIRRLVDLAVLVGLILLIGLSVAATDTIESLIEWFAGGGRSLLLTATTWLLVLLVNVVLATALLAAVPRLRMPPRRLLPAVMVVALGITLLNSVGRYYVLRTAGNPAYKVVASAIALLVYLYLFNQLLLFGAAIAATSGRGSVIDLAAGPPPRDAEPTEGAGATPAALHSAADANTRNERGNGARPG